MNRVRETRRDSIMVRTPGDKNFPLELLAKFALPSAAISAMGIGIAEGAGLQIDPMVTNPSLVVAGAVQMGIAAKSASDIVLRYDDSARSYANGLVYGLAIGAMATIGEYEGMKYLVENYF